MAESIGNFFSAIGGFFNDIFQNILNFLWDFLFMLLQILFGWINIPQFPDSLKNSINSFLDLIFNNLTFLGFFVRPSTLKIVIPLAIFMFNFKYIYKLTMWIIKKIPFLNIK